MPSNTYLIRGITSVGQPFRPSDWAERLCGVMSPFQPEGHRAASNRPMEFSPYVRPVMVEGVKCVLVDERLEAIEPMAMEFVRNFARDNDLPFEPLVNPGLVSPAA